MSSYNDNIFLYADNRAIIFASQNEDGVAPYVRDYKGSPLQINDVWVDCDKNCVRLWQNTGTGARWQRAGVYGNSKINPNIQQSIDAQLEICDQAPKADGVPGLVFSTGSNRTIMYSVVSQNDVLYFTKADGSVVMSLNAAGDVSMTGNLTVTGDLFADDVSYDVNQCNTLKVADDIVHVGNETNKIAFATDKMTLDASGTSIVLDDTAMTDKVVVTGQTKFINNIDDVPDIYLQNHVHHSGDINTRMGFPANDQIALRTGGTDRVLVTDTVTTIGPAINIADGTPRLRANMSGTPISSRFAIQNSTANGNTRFYLIPNGTGSISAINMRNDSAFDDTLPYQAADIGIVGGEYRLTASGSNGSSDPPITMRLGAVEKFRMSSTSTQISGDGSASSGLYVWPTGEVSIGAAVQSYKCYISGGASTGALRIASDASNVDFGLLSQGSTRSSINARVSSTLGNDYGELVLSTRNANAMTVGLVMDGLQNITVNRGFISGFRGKQYGVSGSISTTTGVYNTGLTASGVGIYDLVFAANPNNGGSGVYNSCYEGRVYLRTGWNGSTTTTYIGYSQLLDGTANGIGALTITAWLRDSGGNYYGSVPNANISNYTIAIQVAGYSTGWVNAAEQLYLAQKL